MSRILDDYLLEIRTRLLDLPYADQDAVMAEVRAHLASDIEARRKADPTLSQDELEIAATAAFGDPDDVTVAYGPHGGLVHKRTGAVLLRAAVLTGRAAKATGKAAGRGLRATLKWTGIVAAVLLGVALVLVIVGAYVGTQLADTYHDEIVGAVPHNVYQYQAAWGATDPHTDIRQDSFTVPPDSREVQMQFQTAQQTGCAAIQLTSPSGQVTSLNGNGCSDYSQKLTFMEPGTWKVQYAFAAYTGSVHGQADVYRRPA